VNYQHLHFQFPAKPFQKWHVVEDRSGFLGRSFRHFRQPGEKPDPKVNFGPEELSPRLEHAGVEYLRIALGFDEQSFILFDTLLFHSMGSDDGRWYPVIPWVRDDGFYAVCMRERMPFREACHLFGFDVPAGKPSVPKRIKRDVARGKTSLFGELLETRQLNQWDLLHTVLLADGETTFEVATYHPGDRWPEAWTSGAALASPRGGAILTGHPVKIGDLIQITGAMPNGQIKGNCLIWDIDHDLVVWDVKPELRAWQGQIYLSVLNELHGGPANLDVQTASNLDLAKVRDHKLIQYLCQQYACDVFDLMRDDDRVKEEIGFYNPSSWVDEDTNPVTNENRWKLWRMYSAGLPAMQFRFCRDAFYRTQMESPENNDPDRFRMRFRDPGDLMTVQAHNLAGAAVRRYIFPDPFVFDEKGYPHWNRSTLPDINSVYLGGFDGEIISLRNPNASHKESGKLRGRKLQRFAEIDQGAAMFVHLGFAASPDGTPGMAKSFNGADFDDSVLALLDPEIVRHWETLPAYPFAAAKPADVKFVDDGDALFERNPTVAEYDRRYVICMFYDARRGQTGIGFVVNAITWFNLLWLNRAGILAELRGMPPNAQVADAIRWMEQELPKSRMPMVASRLEEIIDSIKMNGKSVDWANGIITEFRDTCPVAPKFWWKGGYQGQGRIPRDRIENGNAPIPVTTSMDVAHEQWIELFQKARRFADKESWRHCWQVPPEIRNFPTRPEAKAAARDFWMFYNQTRETKKPEFLRTGQDHRGKKITSEQDAGIAAYLYAEEEVHNRIKASGMYLEIYAELVKLVFDRGLTLEPPRNPDGTVKPLADGILGGPHTVDGLLDICRAAGVTRRHVPLTWESARVREDYGDLNLDIVVEDTLVRIAGSSSNSANWIGIVDLPDGQYRMEHGLVVTKDTNEAPTQQPVVALVAVNNFEQRLNDRNLKRADRQRIEAELKAFRAQVCNGVTIKPVTYHNPRSQEHEAGAEVFLEGAAEPLAWISPDQLPLVKGELSGVLVSGGQYTLKALCPLTGDTKRSRPLGVQSTPANDVDCVPPRNGHGLSLEVVNGWQYKINRGIATPGDLESWKAKAGSSTTLRPTTFVRAGIPEPAVAVYVDGYAGQFGWIAKEQIPAVNQELRGYLARNGKYTLTFICDQAA
jgi:hypothetical protein